MPEPRAGIVFCDLDDTFLSSGKHLLPRNMAALDLLAERGIAFVPCTGRGLNAIEVYPELAAHPAVRYAITSSGAVVYDMPSRTVIHSCTVGHGRALALYELVKDLDVSFDVFADGRTFAERLRFRVHRPVAAPPQASVRSSPGRGCPVVTGSPVMSVMTVIGSPSSPVFASITSLMKSS